jgi:hypothetical protein
MNVLINRVSRISLPTRTNNTRYMLSLTMAFAHARVFSVSATIELVKVRKLVIIVVTTILVESMLMVVTAIVASPVASHPIILGGPRLLRRRLKAPASRHHMMIRLGRNSYRRRRGTVWRWGCVVAHIVGIVVHRLSVRSGRGSTHKGRRRSHVEWNVHVGSRRQRWWWTR